jgi:hypothetical protein
MSFETITTGLAVLPQGAAIYHECCTMVELEHEVGNKGHEPVVTLRQSDDGIKPGQVRICNGDWLAIRAAVDRLLGLA